jgi:NAD(P)-dependent dehydrogenase (short-subunit alcohol dehydrogenase family)
VSARSFGRANHQKKGVSNDHQPGIQPRVAIVTGGSRGIGRACVERLAGDGLSIVVGYASNESAVPLERLGTPEDMASVVAFLASPTGHWVNGQTIRANGGMN